MLPNDRFEAVVSARKRPAASEDKVDFIFALLYLQVSGLKLNSPRRLPKRLEGDIAFRSVGRWRTRLKADVRINRYEFGPVSIGPEVKSVPLLKNLGHSVFRDRRGEISGTYHVPEMP